MKNGSRFLRAFGTLTVVLGLFLVSSTALWAESCPLCYSKAMSSGRGLLQAFRHGILILMLPPFAMSLVIFVTAYRRRNSFRSR
jgi:hypothetical protein